MSSKEDIFNYSIQPWSSQDEFIQFYEILFPKDKSSNTNSSNINNNNLDIFIESLSIQNLKKSMIYLIKWDSRGDNKMFCLPILLLVNTIIKIKEQKINNKDINSNHILGEIIIRVINIIMDQLRKNKKANSLNMYLIAKNLELPEFIVDIRHACTHKNLPGFNELKFAVEYTFFWIKNKFIEPKYLSFIKEKKYFLHLINQLNNEIEKNIDSDNQIKLELEHLLIIITQLFINIKKHFIYNKSKNTISYNKEKINPKILIFIKLLEKEKEVFILMIFSFIYQQIKKINSNEKISNEEKNKYKQYLICFSKLIYNNIDKKIKFDLKKYEELYLSIYNNINDIKNEFKIIYEIFSNIFKNSIKNLNFEKDDEFNENKIYVNLGKIEGNINKINFEEKINEIMSEQSEIDIDNNISNDEEDVKMKDERDKIEDILNRNIRDYYKNFNSIII